MAEASCLKAICVGGSCHLAIPMQLSLMATKKPDPLAAYRAKR